jgi:hypothetical protein
VREKREFAIAGFYAAEFLRSAPASMEYFTISNSHAPPELGAFDIRQDITNLVICQPKNLEAARRPFRVMTAASLRERSVMLAILRSAARAG